ncbi:hypothetical protein BDV06DRAFT_215568 [Aspergillus oleicola]
MGWISFRSRDEQPFISVAPSEQKGAYSVHTEDISNPTEPELELEREPQAQTQPSPFLGKQYPLEHPSTPDSDLPFIDPSIVALVEKHWKQSNNSPIVDRSKSKTISNLRQASGLSLPAPQAALEPPVWIVIDNIIYDCTTFQYTHPGGSAVIRNFVGQDCTWQFWRFHSQQQLQEYGRGLRVGRTKGVVNRFKEVPRFVGVSSGNGGLDDDWGW